MARVAKRKSKLEPGRYEVGEDGELVRIEEPITSTAEDPPLYIPPPPEPTPPPKAVNMEIMEEILGGPPDSVTTKEADYRGSPGESIPMYDPNAVGAPLNAAPNMNQLDNIKSKLHHIEERLEVVGEIIRRQMTAAGNMEIRMRQVEDRVGNKAGLRIQ